jgi:dihydroorotate dehydrogenase (fumarate)
MGLKLKNPIVASASGLTKDVAGVKRLAAAGVGAVVLKSIFEEQITHEVEAMMGPDSTVPQHTEALDYISVYGTAHAEEIYLNRVRESCAAVEIPVIASVHCVSAGKWIDFARKAQDAGAAGIELNVNIPSFDPAVDGRVIETAYFDVARGVKAAVTIPCAIKISSQFSGLANFLVRLSYHTDALVLFNRYFHRDIDVESMRYVSGKTFSEPREYENSLRWISVLNEAVKSDLAASTGVHNPETAIKLLLAGASTVQLCSVLYEDGVGVVEKFLVDIAGWMDRHDYPTVDSFRGAMSRYNSSTPAQFDRVQFMKFSAGHE